MTYAPTPMLSFWPHKREFLARRLRDAGALCLLERLARRPVLLVVTLHRIGDPAASPYYRPVFSATPDALRELLRWLRDRFRVLALDEAAERPEVREPSALVTFDDGYRDNFDAAWPVLSALGVPATFFLPTDFLERPRLPWWDHAAYVIGRTGRGRFTLDWPEPLTIEPGPGDRSGAVERVIRLYLDGKVPDEARFRAHLEDRAGVAVDEAGLGRELFLSWDQVRRLVEGGMAVGSHAHGHPRLSALPEDAQRAELVTSKRLLEERTGREVRALAYPFGWEGTYTALTERLAREAGYRLAFTAREGVNRPGSLDPFALRRLAVGSADSPALFRARAALQTAFGGSFL